MAGYIPITAQWSALMSALALISPCLYYIKSYTIRSSSHDCLNEVLVGIVGKDAPADRLGFEENTDRGLVIVASCLA
jgi:hypothetical protein